MVLGRKQVQEWNNTLHGTTQKTNNILSQMRRNSGVERLNEIIELLRILHTNPSEKDLLAYGSPGGANERTACDRLAPVLVLLNH